MKRHMCFAKLNRRIQPAFRRCANAQSKTMPDIRMLMELNRNTSIFYSVRTSSQQCRIGNPIIFTNYSKCRRVFPNIAVMTIRLATVIYNHL